MPLFFLGTREWRNRQTRTVQVRVPVMEWGFNSPLAHDETADPLRICGFCFPWLRPWRGLKDKKSWSEPDLSALWCEKVWFKVGVKGQKGLKDKTCWFCSDFSGYRTFRVAVWRWLLLVEPRVFWAPGPAAVCAGGRRPARGQRSGARRLVVCCPAGVACAGWPGRPRG